MGAKAIYMGTAFMATDECPISPRYKQSIVDLDPFDPKLREKIFAQPDPNRDRKLRHGEALSNGEERETRDKGWQEYDEKTAFRVARGSMAVGVIDRVKPVKELIDDIIREAEDLLREEGPLRKDRPF